METKHLMIGDWMAFKYSDLAHQVKAIKGISIKFDKGNWYSSRTLSPIPLTKDILYKNFPSTLGNVYWMWDDEKSNEVEDWFMFSISGKNVKVNMEIRYVHELQHALRLCGINKEIEL